MVKKRRRHPAAYTFRIALEALEGSKTISQLSREHAVHPNMIRAWKLHLLEDGSSDLARSGGPPGSESGRPRISNSINRSRGLKSHGGAEERFVFRGRQPARCRSEPAAFA